jgi:hypothetical protein
VIESHLLLPFLISGVVVESSLPSTSVAETVYETTPRKPKFETEIDDDKEGKKMTMR